MSRINAIPSKFPTRRTELISKEQQWQKRQESFEKRILSEIVRECELEDSLECFENIKNSDTSKKKTLNADKEEVITDK